MKKNYWTNTDLTEKSENFFIIDVKKESGRSDVTHNKKSLGGKGSAVQRDCSKKKKTRKGNKNNIWILIQTLMHDRRK